MENDPKCLSHFNLWRLTLCLESVEVFMVVLKQSFRYYISILYVHWLQACVKALCCVQIPIFCWQLKKCSNCIWWKCQLRISPFQEFGCLSQPRNVQFTMKPGNEKKTVNNPTSTTLVNKANWGSQSPPKKNTFKQVVQNSKMSNVLKLPATHIALSTWNNPETWEAWKTSFLPFLFGMETPGRCELFSGSVVIKVFKLQTPVPLGWIFWKIHFITLMDRWIWIYTSIFQFGCCLNFEP